MRIQGWDPVLLICQIISLQTIHYLSLSVLVPSLVSFTKPSTLIYSGGPSTVGHILDWREMAARSTVSSSVFNGLLDISAKDSWKKLEWAWAGGKHVGDLAHGEDSEKEGKKVDPGKEQEDAGLAEMEEWDLGVDDTRGWLIAFAWIIASAIDIVPLYYLIRRPTHILDFSLTLTFIHLILASYHSKSFPTSMFFWVVMSTGAIMMVVVAEQLCVKREMRTELEVGWNVDNLHGDEIELGHLAR